MTPREYANRAAETAIYDPEKWHDYLAPAIVAECGEVVGRFAKHVRDCDGTRFGAVECETCRPKLVDELGDLLWVTMMYLRHLDEERIPERWALLQAHVQEHRPQRSLELLQRRVAYFSFAWLDDKPCDSMLVIYLVQRIDEIAAHCTVDLVDIAERNLLKLAGRAERGTLGGDGER